MQILLEELQHFLIRVEFVGADVHHRLTHVGYNIVLCAGFNHGHLHKCRPQQFADTLEAIVAQPLQVVEEGVDGIHPLVAGSVSRAAMRREVDHHQSFFCHSRLHSRWLTHNGYIDSWQQGQCLADAILS